MDVKQAEATLFWQMSSELRFALHEGADQTEIDDLYGEVEGVMVNTENDEIRSRCVSLLRTRSGPADFGVA
jgi:hypothetical protein